MLLLVKICGGCHGNVLPIFSSLKIAQYFPHFFGYSCLQIKTSGNLVRRFHSVFFRFLSSTAQTPYDTFCPQFGCHEKMIFLVKLKTIPECLHFPKEIMIPEFFTDQDKYPTKCGFLLSRRKEKYRISLCSSSQRNSEALGNADSLTVMTYLVPSYHLDRNKYELPAFLNQISLLLDSRALPEGMPCD